LTILALLALPTAVLSAPALAAVAAHAGMDTSRLRVRLLCVLIAALLTSWAVQRSALSEGWRRIFYVYPIVAAIGWMMCLRTGLDEGRFWPAPGGNPAGWWSVGIPVTAVLAATLTSLGRRWSLDRWIGLIPAAVLCYSTLGASRIVSAYVVPHYSMKQASQDLGVSLADSPSLVATASAEGLFNGNALPYRTVLGRTWPTDRPDTIVIAFAFHDPEGLLGREYRLTASYRLYVSPEYEQGGEHAGPEGGKVEVVRVYRRELPGSAAGTRAPEPAVRRAPDRLADHLPNPSRPAGLACLRPTRQADSAPRRNDLPHGENPGKEQHAEVSQQEPCVERSVDHPGRAQ
jgi:hypothetical protein